jgi:hypothetical protein
MQMLILRLDLHFTDVFIIDIYLKHLVWWHILNKLSLIIVTSGEI